MVALNYNRWNVCSDAVRKGQELKLPLYQFLKQPLIRRFGEDKKWCAMFYFIEEDYSVHIDLEYDFPKGDMFEQHDAVFRKIYHTEYKAIKGKYPATE